MTAAPKVESAAAEETTVDQIEVTRFTGTDPAADPAKDDDAFRTIGEAAAELGLKPHVLRFWETKFEELSPFKRADGRRYYRSEDMETLRTLQRLLHVDGLTIKGAQRVLAGGEAGEGDEAESGSDETGVSVRDLQAAVSEAVARGDFHGANEPAPNPAARERLQSLLAEMTDLKSRLDLVRKAGCGGR